MTDLVFIVGGVPSGLTAALELSRLGIPTCLIARRDDPAATGVPLVFRHARSN